MTRAEKEIAYNLGKAAFHSGKPCVPARDEALMAMIRAVNTLGEGGKLSRAWTDGYTAGNLKAPV